MSRFEVDLNKKERPAGTKPATFLSENAKPQKKSVLGRVLKIFAVLVFILIVIGAVSGFFYWRYIKTTPQYSLALLVEAARENEQKKVDELVNTDSVVDDFLPQITDKAIELYGRGLPREILKKVTRVAAPLLPAVKDRARAELPGLIRQKTQRFDGVPFWVIAIGAERFLDIRQEGDKAFIKSKAENRPFEIVMKKNGELWQVVAVKDEALARKIAEKIGKEIMELAKKKGEKNLRDAGKEIGVENLQELFKDFTDIFKQ